MKKNLKITLFFTLAYGLAYGTAIFSTYAFTDDICVLWAVNYEGMNLLNNYVSQAGRPIYGVLLNIFFSMVDGFDTMHWLRLLGLVGIISFGFVACNTFRRAGHTVLVSCFMALLISLTPSFAVYAGWAVCFPYPFAGALAWLAGDRVIRMPHERKGSHLILRLVPWSVLLIATMAIYQPVAAFYLLPALVYANRMDTTRRDFRQGLLVLGTYIASALIYYVLYKMSLQWWLTGPTPARAELATDFVKQLYFLYTTPLRFGCLMWSVFYGPLTQIVVGAFIALFLFLGLVLYIRHAPKYGLWYLFLFGAAVFCSVAPMFITAGGGAPFRTLGVLSSLCIYQSLIGLLALCSLTRRGTKFQTPALVILCVGAIAVSGYHLYDGIVRPQKKELSLYRSYFRETFTEYPKNITFILPDYGSIRLSRFPAQFEFGIISSQFDWFAVPMINLLLNERFFLNQANTTKEQLMNLHIICVSAECKIDILNPPIVDGNLVISGKKAPVNIFSKANPAVHPYFGELLEYGQGWCYSPWFGYIYVADFPHIIHFFLGNLDCAGEGNGDYWFYSKEAGWFWTSPSSFPAVYSSPLSDWIRLQVSSNHPFSR